MHPDALASQPAALAQPRTIFQRRSGASLLWRVVTLAERCACIVALLLLSPIWLTVAVAITVLSGEGPLIAVLRSGRFGRPLWLLKFRTMWSGSRGTRWPIFHIEHIVDEQGPAHKESSDHRVTSAWARFCRRFSIDEIPQLLNVVGGEMSLVGPRPLTSSELSRYYGKDAAEVLSVRPGISGLWQVNGRNSLPHVERRRLDVLLIRTLSLKLYLRILLRTIPVVLTGRNSW